MISAVACLATLPVGCAGAGSAPSLEPDAAPAEDLDGDDEEASLRRKISRGGLGLVRARGRLAELLAARLPDDDEGRRLSTQELESLREIVGLDPSRQGERLRLGRALLTRGAYTDALAVLEGDAACEACVALRPGAYLDQGLQALAADEGEAAAVAFERSFALAARPEPLLHRARGRSAPRDRVRWSTRASTPRVRAPVSPPARAAQAASPGSRRRWTSHPAGSTSRSRAR